MLMFSTKAKEVGMENNNNNRREHFPYVFSYVIEEKQLFFTAAHEKS